MSDQGPSVTEDEASTCSFCGLRRDHVRLMLSGMSGCICDECILATVEILIDKAAHEPSD